MQQIVTSTTDSHWTNVIAHGAKVSAAALVTHAAISRIGINRHLMRGSLLLSAMTFTLPAYTFNVMDSLVSNYEPAPYNQAFNRLWGKTTESKTRMLFPLATGVQIALFASALKHLQRPLQFLVCALVVRPQILALATALSVPPQDDWDRWLISKHPRWVTISLMTGEVVQRQS